MSPPHFQDPEDEHGQGDGETDHETQPPVGPRAHRVSSSICTGGRSQHGRSPTNADVRRQLTSWRSAETSPVSVTDWFMVSYWMWSMSISRKCVPADSLPAHVRARGPVDICPNTVIRLSITYASLIWPTCTAFRGSSHPNMGTGNARAGQRNPSGATMVRPSAVRFPQNATTAANTIRGPVPLSPAIMTRPPWSG